MDLNLSTRDGTISCDRMGYLEFALQIVTFLACLSLLEAFYSLAGGLRYYRLLREAANRPPGCFAPPVSLILPCRGEDTGLQENLHAYFRQDYPDFQILFVTGRPADPSTSVFRRVAQNYPDCPQRLLFSGSSRIRGQKVHNLLHALEYVRESDRVLAFGDSDIRPSPHWLRYLVAPLEDVKIGASTGYRWYLSKKWCLAGILRSAWNAGTASLMQERNCHFAWGGSMAIRRSTFEECQVTRYWQGALSDDYTLGRAVKESHLVIGFQPRCLSFSYGTCCWKEFFNFISRQISITRVYSPGLWTAGFFAQALHCLSFWGGAVVLITAVSLGSGSLQQQITLGLLWITIYGLGCVKSALRLRAVAKLMPKQRSVVYRYRSLHLFSGPLVAALTLWGIVGSLWKREIEWRGIRYRMISSRETIVVGDVPDR